jgi:hypothetical protein
VTGTKIDFGRILMRTAFVVKRTQKVKRESKVEHAQFDLYAFRTRPAPLALS